MFICKEKLKGFTVIKSAINSLGYDPYKHKHINKTYTHRHCINGG